MKLSVLKNCFSVFSFKPAVCSLFVALVAMQAQAVPQGRYLDCWLKPSSEFNSLEKFRLNLKDDQAVCGCFEIRETDKQVTRVWDLPKHRVVDCAGGSCINNGQMGHCMDHVREQVIKLSDFLKDGPMQGAVNMNYGDENSPTPFGEYYNQRKERAKDVDCFVNVHARPGVDDKADWRSPYIFSLSGLPRILIPEAIGRTPDYSDVRCLDNNVLTGFAHTGVVENVRHIDEEGNITGEEIGYLNDPKYPLKQDSKWGQILWKATYKRGLRDGITTIYKSSLQDGSNQEYYFKHLEVNYKQGFVDGMSKMYSDKGFLMADIPFRRGNIYGRMTIYNPFKKKNLPLNFVAGKLEGFNDLADFGGVFHEGLPNGLITYWTVKDSCYEWMPGAGICYSERQLRKQWGAYKMGIFQGTMECSNGVKGDYHIVCPEPVPPDSSNALVPSPAPAPAVAEESQPAAAPVAPPAPVVVKSVDEPETPPVPQKSEAQILREKAKEAKERALKARLEAQQAAEQAKLAEREAMKALQEAEEAEEAIGEKPKKSKSKAKSKAKSKSKKKKKK
ncbi:MAG: hypothetical protein HUK20_13315 [Fibrobacter sp.]|nr:hypothetical protein [Fibrobacter sp.]